MGLHAPKSLRIGPFDYEVRYLDHDDEDTHRKFGSCNTDAQVIYITSARKRQRVANTFIHEVLHALAHVYSPLSDDDGRVDDEECIDGVALGLSAFVRDNQGAIEWYIDLLLREPHRPHKED